MAHTIGGAVYGGAEDPARPMLGSAVYGGIGDPAHPMLGSIVYGEAMACFHNHQKFIHT